MDEMLLKMQEEIKKKNGKISIQDVWEAFDIGFQDEIKRIKTKYGII